MSLFWVYEHFQGREENTVLSAGKGGIPGWLAKLPVFHWTQQGTIQGDVFCGFFLMRSGIMVF